jgi:hypothetical protein
MRFVDDNFSLTHVVQDAPSRQIRNPFLVPSTALAKIYDRD